ncbi:MAG: HD domain-containing protein [Firmicutes bacterium]|nr:HD domain-containing protein [Bacillota bacterium]
MEKQFIQDLKIGDAVHSDFVVTEKALNSFSQPNRAGEYYLRLQIADATGSMRAVAWERGPELAALFEQGDVVRIRGEVTNYRGLQLIVYDLQPTPEKEIKRHYFLKTAPRSCAEMLTELEAVINSVTNPHLRLLLNSFFHDEFFVRRFCEAPAARSVHHNYVGGLLEHSLEVAALCRQFIALQPALDPSLLLSGALLHDIGKIEEYEFRGMAIELTTKGKLLGHIIIGKEMIDHNIEKLPAFPKELQLALGHMILAHHGQQEWGSPQIPRTFEAFALHHADLVSARLNQFAQAQGKGAKTNGWTDWDRLLARDIYLGLAE